MGAMPTVDGSPMCVRHRCVLEMVSKVRWVTGDASGWCEPGDHYVTETDADWGHEAIPLDQYVVATHTIQLLPLRFCRDCAAERPSRVFEDGGHTCMACGLSQDPSEAAKEGE